MTLGFSESAAGCRGRTEQPRRKKGVCIQVSRLARKARQSADGQYLVLLTEAKRLILLGNAPGGSSLVNHTSSAVSHGQEVYRGVSNFLLPTIFFSSPLKLFAFLLHIVWSTLLFTDSAKTP